jgi:hypothetical protein
MAAITFDRFDLGIDLRKGASVSDANRLREMKNAHVTTGLATQKRPGIIKVTTLEPGTRGLFAAFGKLHTFYGQGTIAHEDSRFVANKVAHSGGSVDVVDVPFADVFNAYIYVAVTYANGVTEHHYLDGTTPTHIVDVNCPDSPAVIKLAGKIFATNGDTVRYSATEKPRDWTSANDAGFLPTGLNFQGDRSANGLGEYKSNLAVLSRDGVQIWLADPDPTAMAIQGKVKNVGTSFPRSIADVGGDMYFLSDYGFRSITTLQYTNSLSDVDIGSPIDPIVRQETRQESLVPKAFYYYGTGQYICAIGNRLFVYSLSRTSKIAAWSQYYLPFEVDAFAELDRSLYLRNGDDIYQLSEEVYTDNGQKFEVLLELPYMDFKKPGDLKRIYGMDVVMEGGCQFNIGFDARNPDAVTPAFKIKGNTRGGGMIPVEVSGTEFSLRFRNFDDKPFRLDAITLYYESLGPL